MARRDYLFRYRYSKTHPARLNSQPGQGVAPGFRSVTSGFGFVAAMIFLSVMAGTAAGGAIEAQPAEVRGITSPSPFAAAYETVAPAVVRVLGAEEYSTGLIVSADGLILTHNDVVWKNEMSVYFADGRESKAKVLLRDAATKTAVLQLIPPVASSSSAATSAKPASSTAAGRRSWKAAKLGSSKKLAVGAWVGTVAYPVGADAKDESQPSLGVGLLVARGPLKTAMTYGGEWLATDAMMNEASEGGALIDAQGQVVGLLSKPQRNEETNTALNLALPAEVAADLIKRARETPDPAIKEEPGNLAANQGYLGVISSTKATACRINNVVPDSPAAKAGLKVNDVIVRFGKAAIGNYRDLRRELRQTKPGDKIRVAVRRPGEEKEREIEVTLGTIPAKK